MPDNEEIDRLKKDVERECDRLERVLRFSTLKREDLEAMLLLDSDVAALYAVFRRVTSDDVARLALALSAVAFQRGALHAFKEFSR